MLTPPRPPAPRTSPGPFTARVAIVLVDPPDHARQRLARADLDRLGHALRGHPQHALAPAHPARHLLDQQPPDLVRIADRRGRHIGHQRHGRRLRSPPRPAPPPSPPPPAASARNGTARSPAAASPAWRRAPWRSPPPARPPPGARRPPPAPDRCRSPPRRPRPAPPPPPPPRPRRSRARAAPPSRPRPTGTASCIARPRSRSSRAVSPRLIAPAAQSAEYSPSECPATKAARSMPNPSASSARSAAIEVAISAGCAFSVSVSVGDVAVPDQRRQLLAQRVVHLVEHRPRRRIGLAPARAPCRPPARPARERRNARVIPLDPSCLFRP